jgi:glutaconate CoA-transferase, subunit B
MRQVEFVAILARMLAGRRHPLIGTNAPAPAAAALLARVQSGGAMRLTIIGSAKYNTLTDDLGEVFDSAARGVFDAFFIGGGQIDGEANVNLVGIGTYPRLEVRWPGSHGTPLLYLMIPNAIMYLRGEHSRRALVPRVDFVSAPGTSEAGVHRPGGPVALVTPRCIFDFSRDRRRFSLRSVHPGHTVEEIKANTGFAFDLPDAIAQTPSPSPDALRLIAGHVAAEIAPLFPKYAAQLRSEAEAMLAEAPAPEVLRSAP